MFLTSYMLPRSISSYFQGVQLFKNAFFPFYFAPNISFPVTWTLAIRDMVLFFKANRMPRSQKTYLSVLTLYQWIVCHCDNSRIVSQNVEHYLDSKNGECRLFKDPYDLFQFVTSAALANLKSKRKYIRKMLWKLVTTSVCYKYWDKKYKRQAKSIVALQHMEQL
jgi:hypothetical protein